MTPETARPRTFADDFRTAANVLEETPDITLDDEMADALASLLWAAATAAERTGSVDPAALRFAQRIADSVAVTATRARLDAPGPVPAPRPAPRG